MCHRFPLSLPPHPAALSKTLLSAPFLILSHIPGLFEARLQSSPCSGMAGALSCHLSPPLQVAALGKYAGLKGERGETTACLLQPGLAHG